MKFDHNLNKVLTTHNQKDKWGNKNNNILRKRWNEMDEGAWWLMAINRWS